MISNGELANTTYTLNLLSVGQVRITTNELKTWITDQNYVWGNIKFGKILTGVKFLVGEYEEYDSASCYLIITETGERRYVDAGELIKCSTPI